SDVEKYRQVNNIIDQLLPDMVLVNRKSPYTRTRDIIARISELKREGVVDPDRLHEVEDLYEREMAAKSKEGTKVHEKNLLAARKFREFVQVFLKYQEMLKATQRFDFEDMILYCNEALRQEDWLLAGLQERYQYILVDEFQDTNGAQFGLIELLTTARTPEDKPNLFVVGDDDQAIYRFQGANLQNILRFRERFKDAPVIPITVSYRCTQPILDAAGSLIGNNTERLIGRINGLKKDLTASKKSSHDAAPVLLFSPSDATEPWMICDLIDNRLKKGIDPREIAVLCQTNAEILRLYDIMTARGIPVEVTGKADLLGNPFVRQLVAILRAVHDINVDASLAGALGCACFGVHPSDLGRLYTRTNREQSLYSILLDLDTKNEGQELPLVSRPALIKARDVLLDLKNKLPSRTIVDTLEHALKDSGLLRLAKGENGSPFHPLHFSALQEFFNRVKERAYEQPEFRLDSFLSDLDYYGRPEYGDLRPSFSLPHLTEDGVQLMTAHQSKGLEFDVVILSNFREGHWDKRRNPSSLSLPEDLLFGWQKEQKAYERAQDERRLTFVAMTRARSELIFTCPKELTGGDKSRSVSPSGFFAQAGKLSESLHELKDPTQASTLLFTPVPDFDAAMKAFLLDRLKNYSLSVTALNHFLEDPKLFLELDLLSVPQAEKLNMIYGTAVHDALKKWGLSMMQRKSMTQNEFIAAFRKYLEDRRGLLKNERENLIMQGEETLPQYFDERLSGDVQLVHKVEFAVSTHVDDVPIKGKIDRVDLIMPDSSDAVIIDYKTGRPKTEKVIRDEGDYYRQLVFYALLLAQKGALLTPKEFVLDFIGEGGEAPVRRVFTVSASEMEELKKTVKAVWAKIISLDFSPL
ncbi:MAG: ATP-dependent DNA helicase, partial [Candidatus Peribacteraceae bacterium]|nr:ATP-dependent DNA helicase [Candidatus Peribacteraceae bacterium]